MTRSLQLLSLRPVRAAYLLGQSKRLASVNWPSLPENIIHRTKPFTASFTPISCGYDQLRPLRSVSQLLRFVLCAQNRTMCRGVSSPARQQHCAVSKLGTFWLCRNLASPIRPVRACTSRALSAFCSPLCICRTSLVGAKSSKASLRPPRSVLGQSGLSIFAVSACYLTVQSWATSSFSFWFHRSSGPWIHSSVHFFCLKPGVLCSNCTVLCLRQVWFRSLLRTVAHAVQITCASPVLSSLAQYCATRLLSYISSSGTYNSVSS